MAESETNATSDSPESAPAAAPADAPTTPHGRVHETDARGHRVVSMQVLVGVWLVLVVLTALTYGASELARVVPLGTWALVIALAIAVVKGSLVAAYFMHLRYDKPLHAIVLGATVTFVVLFIALVVFDTKQYEPTRKRDYVPKIERRLEGEANQPAAPE